MPMPSPDAQPIFVFQILGNTSAEFWPVAAWSPDLPKESIAVAVAAAIYSLEQLAKEFPATAEQLANLSRAADAGRAVIAAEAVVAQAEGQS